MPKIEGWKKIREGLWQTREYPYAQVRVKNKAVEVSDGYEKKWIVVRPGRRQRKIFDTREEAKDYAVEWMRKHPNKEGSERRREEREIMTK